MRHMLLTALLVLAGCQGDIPIDCGPLEPKVCQRAAARALEQIRRDHPLTQVHRLTFTDNEFSYHADFGNGNGLIVNGD